MSSTDGLTRWLAAGVREATAVNDSWGNECDWYHADNFVTNGYERADAAHMARWSPAAVLAVLAVVQAGPALVFEQQRLIMMLMRPLAEQDDMAVGEQIDVVTELATQHRAALAALRALTEEAPWADQEADVQPSRG